MPQRRFRIACVGAVLAAGAALLPAGAASNGQAAALPSAFPCTESRPAVTYHPGGPAVGLSNLIAPCGSATGFPTREPTIGIAHDKLYFYPAGGGGSIPDPAQQGTSRSVDVAVGVLDLSKTDATWQRQQLGPLPAGNHAVTTDPYFYLDPVTSRLFATDLIAHCSQLSFSDDGANWTRAVDAGCTVADHQTVFAGPSVTSTPSGYPNVVYYCSLTNIISTTSSAAACEKSTDGGLTFLPTGNSAYDFGLASLVNGCGTGGATGHGAVGPDGTVYLPKADVDDGTGQCREQQLAISHDEGATWTHAVVNDTLGVTSTPDAGAAADAGVAVDPAGNIYYTWTAADRALYLSISRDQGQTWSTPQRISAPGLTETAMATVAVSKAGQIAVAYLGSADSPGAPFTGSYTNTSWNGYISVSDDALDRTPTYAAAQVSDPTQPLFTGQCCGPTQDFIDVKIASDGRPFAAFVATTADDWSAGYAGSITARLGSLGLTDKHRHKGHQDAGTDDSQNG